MLNLVVDNETQWKHDASHLINHHYLLRDVMRRFNDPLIVHQLFLIKNS